MEFGLRFESHETEGDEADTPPDDPDGPPDPGPAKDAEVVRLDAFRKT